jgi:hypothetical protein
MFNANFSQREVDELRQSTYVDKEVGDDLKMQTLDKDVRESMKNDGNLKRTLDF